MISFFIIYCSVFQKDVVGHPFLMDLGVIDEFEFVCD